MKRPIILIIGLSFTAAARAGTISVPGEFATIQECIDGAVSGVDECVVAPGTYNETINFHGKAITLRSSDGPAVTIIDGTGLNDSVVKCLSGEQPDTVLQGFTITGGTGTAVPPSGVLGGGGMINYQSSPTVINCVFKDNAVTSADREVYGGGMYNFESSPTLEKCTFANNHAIGRHGHGGGLYNEYSSPTIDNCAFTGNQANHGAGMYNLFDSDPTVANCTFTGNSATINGG